MSSQSGSASANAALVRESVEALNAGDTERLLTVVAPDTVYAVQRKPVASGRGVSGLAGRSPGGCSSL